MICKLAAWSIEGHRLGQNAGIQTQCIVAASGNHLPQLLHTKAVVTKLQEYISTNAEKLGEMHMNESSKTESNAFKVCSTTKHNCYLELVAEGTFWPDELYPTKLIQSLEWGQQHQTCQINYSCDAAPLAHYCQCQVHAICTHLHTADKYH